VRNGKKPSVLQGDLIEYLLAGQHLYEPGGFSEDVFFIVDDGNNDNPYAAHSRSNLPDPPQREANKAEISTL
jgi:hypothetical protein